MKVTKIKTNSSNPRIIRDAKFKKLVNSIKDFPKMMSLRPIVIDTDGTILGGNMRYKAILSLGYKEIPDEWVKVANELTDEEKQRFIIEDNVAFGDWDFDILANEWDTVDLEEWGMELPMQSNEINADDFFNTVENETNEEVSDEKEQIIITLPEEYNEQKNEIIEIIETALRDYKGIKIK